MRKSLGKITNEWTDDEVYGESRGEIVRTVAYESGITEDLHELKKKEKRKERMPLRFLRRTRHWTDGLIIGKKAFVQEVAIQFYDSQRVLKKRLSSGADQNGKILHCYRRLKVGV